MPQLGGAVHGGPGVAVEERQYLRWVRVRIRDSARDRVGDRVRVRKL